MSSRPVTFAIIDYGAGNLKNVASALTQIGAQGIITADPTCIAESDAIILPGVGAFPDAMESLNASGLRESLDQSVAAGKYLLGICLGMQMLFESSAEMSRTAGLGYIPGTVEPIPAVGHKIPHMGWNELVLEHPDDKFLTGILPGDHVYFVHSYAAVPADFKKSVAAWADYGIKVPGVVRAGNVIGTQFHPEKSGTAGMRMLENLKEMVK